MNWIDILENVDHEKESQETTVKSCYRILRELERIVEIKNRNVNNKELKEFHNNRLKQIRKVYMKMVFSLSGWETDNEISNLIYNYNRLEKEVKAI